MDLSYDIDTMDLVIENGDLVLTDDLSAQNGGILLYCKNFNLSQPTAGVKISHSMGGKETEILNKLDEWTSQVINDGGTNVKTSYDALTNEFKAECTYE